MKSLTGRVAFVAELLAIGTATAFIFSGLANAIVFGVAWRLNYFTIASPADVVMSAFIVVLLTLVVAIPLAFLVFFGWVFLSSHRKLRDAMDRAAEAAEAENDLTFVRIRRGHHRRASAENLLLRAAKQQSYVTALVSIMTGVIGLLATAGGLFFSEVRQAPTSEGRGREQFSYATGLRLAPDQDVTADCWAAPIVWMGTDRLVLGCQPGVRVVTLSDSMVLQSSHLRVPTRQEFLLSERSEALHDRLTERFAGLLGQEIMDRLAAGETPEEIAAGVDVPGPVLADEGRTEGATPETAEDTPDPAPPPVQP